MKSHVSTWLFRDVGTQGGKLVLLLLAALFLTSFLMGDAGSSAISLSFQSPVSPISPVISPPEPVAEPAATPIPQPAAPGNLPSAASTPVLWIVIGLVVVGAFVMGLVFFQKRRE